MGQPWSRASRPWAGRAARPLTTVVSTSFGGGHEQHGGNHVSRAPQTRAHRPIQGSRSSRNVNHTRHSSTGPPQKHRRSGHSVRIIGSSQPRRRPRTFRQRSDVSLANCLRISERGGYPPSASCPCRSHRQNQNQHRSRTLRPGPSDDVAPAPSVRGGRNSLGPPRLAPVAVH